MTPAEYEETITIFQGLVAGHAEHSERLLLEKRALLDRIRELEQKPPTYDDWRAAAYVEARNAAVDALSVDLKAHVENLDTTIVRQKKELDHLHGTWWTASRKRTYWMRLALANRARAGQLDRLYRKWRARALAAEKITKDRWAFVDSERVVLREQVRSERNNALEEAKGAVRAYAEVVGTRPATPAGEIWAAQRACEDLGKAIENLKEQKPVPKRLSVKVRPVPPKEET